MRGLCAAILTVAALASAVAPAAAASDAWGEPVREEPRGPAVSAEVQAPLDEAARRLEEKEVELSLGAAERALAEARARGDSAGEGFACAARARALEALKRSEEALAAWVAAADRWTALGAGPERIEALCARAALLVNDQPEQASSLIEEAVRIAEAEERRPRAAIAGLNRAADRMLVRFAIGGTKRLSEAAVGIGEKRAPGSLEVAKGLNNLGRASRSQGDLAAARDYHLRALEIREKHAPGSLDVASSLNNLGIVLQGQGDLVAARDYHLRSLEIRERLAPGSLDVATSLNNLGMVARDQGELAVARDYHLRSLEIREKHPSAPLDVASSLNNLGIVAHTQGDLAAARDYYLRALEIREKHASGSLDLAGSLNNLGIMVHDQGDLAAAQDYYLRSLAIREKQAPGSLDVGTSLNNLGLVRWAQGDLAAARDYLLRANEIQEKHASGSLDVAAGLNNLGLVAHSQGDLAAARDYFLRALEIQEKQASGSLDVAGSLNNLGLVAHSQGDLAAARDYCLRALEIHEEYAPGSIYVTYSLGNLGLVAADRGDFAAARDYHLRALEIQEKNAPDSLDVAASFNNLGEVASIRGDIAEVERRQDAAWRIVRGQRRAVTGDEAGRGFAASFTAYAARLVKARIALGKSTEAFGTLEEARAQGLLRLLSERGLGRSEVDPALWSRYETSERVFLSAGQDLAAAGAEAEQLAREVEALEDVAGDQIEITRAALSDAKAKREAALSTYTQARLEQEQLLSEVRRAVPGLTARVFSFEDARRALPANSVFVAWSLGEEESAVFVIPSDRERPVEAQILALGEKRLGEQVAALRERVGSAPRGRGIGGLAAAPAPGTSELDLVTESRALYDALFPAGARSAIEAAEHVILSPDGTMWELPFAALVMNMSGDPAWLGLEKPLSYTASLTVLVLERESAHRSSGVTRALVVGDPVFVRMPKPAAGAAPPVPVSMEVKLRGERALLTASGVPPDRLPASALEARRVAALYGVEPLLGEAATEAAVRGKLPTASIVHLATHGLFHPALAMSSGVLLTPPEEVSTEKTDDDGALQAWEFGRMLPLSAELVVLSACETGRGEKVRGEGLVGLTRALQAAGARSVVATHWKVADESTAELMVGFHENLRRGLAKDEALRQAMIAAAARHKTRHPFFWAPFFLTGDADRPLEVARRQSRAR